MEWLIKCVKFNVFQNYSIYNYLLKRQTINCGQSNVSPRKSTPHLWKYTQGKTKA